jgi:hypothetical protein
MSKEYFSHDYGTRNKKRMAALLHDSGSRGYGLFWIIVEMLHEDSAKWMDMDDITFIAIKKESGEDIGYIRQFVTDCIEKYKIFICEDHRFTTERVLRNISKREEIREKRAEAGRRSAESKASKSGNDQQTATSVEPVLNVNQQNPTKETKGKESKGKESSNRANALVAPEGATRVTKSEYEKVISEITGKEPKEVWTALKEFITGGDPDFIEPYIDAWNVFASNYKLNQVESISDSRRAKFKTRHREKAFDFFRILEGIKVSGHLKGVNDRNWKVTFDWIIENDKNYLKIIEGNYQA